MHVITLPKSRLERLRQTFKHPDQAAILARVPVIARRVPARGYWRTQGIDARRAATSIRADLGRGLAKARHAGAHAARRGAAAGGHGAMAGASAGGRMSARAAGTVRRSPLAWLFAACAAGATFMYYLDPSAGRRRRALMRDRFAHWRNIATRRVPRTVERRGRFFAGVARGVRHDAATMVQRNGHHYALVDDETLAARVRSEVLRERDIKAGEIHLEAYEGCVTLRGQLGDEAEILHIIEGTRRVDGVREVRSYLHLPGTFPPNKAEAYEASPHLPAHMAR